MFIAKIIVGNLKKISSHSKSWLNPCSHFQTDVHSHDMRKKKSSPNMMNKGYDMTKARKMVPMECGNSRQKKTMVSLNGGVFGWGMGLVRINGLLELRENLFYWPINHSMANNMIFFPWSNAFHFHFRAGEKVFILTEELRKSLSIPYGSKHGRIQPQCDDVPTEIV